jgi:hypothetical protein
LDVTTAGSQIIILTDPSVISDFNVSKAVHRISESQDRPA